ncbi:MAG: hypothetical protein JW956_05825 [Calditrichaceae bacterium]|nr:hypothetical protein [Calditrichaceae bacterium]
MVTKIINIIMMLVIISFVACDGLNDILEEDVPEIEGGLKVSNDKPYPLDTINCSVNATNPVEGELQYSWEVSPNYGTFLLQNDPSAIKWIAPAEHGDYTIKVKVENTEGASKASKKIEVLEAQQPILNGGIVLSDASVIALDTVTASISATNPRTGPLSYAWTKTGGHWVDGISDRDTIRWIAPLTGGNYTLTVVVSNGLSSVQTFRQVNVVSSTLPIVHITSPVNNSMFYLDDPITVTAEAAHENGIALVRFYAITPDGVSDSLIQSKGTSLDGKYSFTLQKAYKDLVGYSTLKVEAEAANQLHTKGSDQISIHVLGIHLGKDGRE